MKVYIYLAICIVTITAYSVKDPKIRKSEPIYDPKENLQNPKDPKDPKDPRDPKDPKDPKPSIDDPKWREYKLKFGKSYETVEEEMNRYSIWKEHLADIEEHNANPVHTYKKGLNQFHDMTSEEFMSDVGNCYKEPEDGSDEGLNWIEPLNVDYPATVDWRTKGYVTPVKNQGQCGSCYAFSAIGSLEGQWYRKTGILNSLSEQNVIDCSGSWFYGNKGCNGGWMTNVFKYILWNRGIDKTAYYPYEGKLGSCRFNRLSICIGATDLGWYNIAANENSLKAAVALYGPISVAFHVADSFRSYKSGVYVENSCAGTLNHAVLVVGYGTENGQDYWLVKNSWGASWGDKGYVKMARNHGNMCGIALKGSFPRV